MTDKILSSMLDPTQSISIDPSALLTNSTINSLHFPDLTTSGISETGYAGRPISLNLDGVGMCESMTESYCSTTGFDETALFNNNNNNGLQSDTTMTNSVKLNGKKDPLTESVIKNQKKRRSRKAQYDATNDGFSLDKIETVPINDEQIEPDDAWLFQVPDNGNRKMNAENIYSWVHKEFKENEINANKHRLLCKLDDMSHARTIRSVSCHSFPAQQRSDSVKRSSTSQQVNSESTSNTRLTSPLRSSTPPFNGNGNTRPTSPNNSSPLRHTVTITNSSNIRSRDVSREREPLDYTDLEVMAKVQLENLRQADRQTPLSKRFGGSSNTLLSADSRDGSPVSVFGATRNTSPVSHTGLMTPRRSHSPNPSSIAGLIPRRKNSFVVTDSQYAHVLPSVSPRSSSPAVRSGQWSGWETPSLLEPCMETSFIVPESSLSSNKPNDAPDGTGTKPPVVPRTKPNNHRRSNTQTIVANVDAGYDIPDIGDTKPEINSTTNRNNAQTTNRTRPAATIRTIQSYRGSQTSYLNGKTLTNLQRNTKKTSVELGTTFTAEKFSSSNENNFLNDLSNKPLTGNVRPQPVNVRRQPVVVNSSIEPHMTGSGSLDLTQNVSSSIPRSSSSLTQQRKSGIPTIGKTSRTNLPTPTRTNTNSSSNIIPTSQSSDNMMATRNLRAQPTNNIVRPKISDATSASSSWNEGCF